MAKSPNGRSRTCKLMNSAWMKATPVPENGRTLNGGKPVGIKALAGALGTSEQNLIDGVEPYLLRAHLVKRTSGGRALTQKGWDYIRPTLEAEGLIEPTLEPGLELPADEEGEELAEELLA